MWTRVLKTHGRWEVGLSFWPLFTLSIEYNNMCFFRNDLLIWCIRVYQKRKVTSQESKPFIGKSWESTNIVDIDFENSITTNLVLHLGPEEVILFMHELIVMILTQTSEENCKYQASHFLRLPNSKYYLDHLFCWCCFWKFRYSFIDLLGSIRAVLNA